MSLAERISIEGASAVQDFLSTIIEVQATTDRGDPRLLWLELDEAERLGRMLLDLAARQKLVPAPDWLGPPLRIVR